ncbi:glycoside hydrolase family 36 protein [Cohnella sp. GbtcB17]|uniref:glycoside hydrolase family 36 protein n=1 Tax=Cohnella sp. GbtcB17 TaxID=2824762 RepID=UPI001C2FABFE|nr:glycoside hydrolase family 36 protein [Cohnella sp. GbtcB17]
MRFDLPELCTASVNIVLSDRVLQGEFSDSAPGKPYTFRRDRLTLSLTADGDTEVRTVALYNEGTEKAALREIRLAWSAARLGDRLDARDYVQLHHTRDFSGSSGVRPVHRPAAWSPAAEPSGMVSVFCHRRTGECILLGALPPYGDCFVDIAVLHAQAHRDGAFGLGFHLRSPRNVAPGERIDLAHLILLHGDDGNALLSAYADLMRQRLAASNFQPPAARIGGWNSWDYYAGAVRAEDVLSNAAEARRRLGDAVRYIVIDEGYECQWGVWDAGWKFPQGLEALCAQIRAEGFEPGIWTAPLMVSVYTPLYRDHPDWFVGDDKSDPFVENAGYGSMVQLDITHPQAEAHIRETFVRLRSAGFTYFKCDFAQLLLGASSFHDPRMSHAGMIRRLYEVIREAIGPDVYLLACGAPYEAVIGIADAHRTTGDIHNYWSHIRHNIRSMQARWWMQGAIGNTDPDTAIVRCADTTDDRQLNRRLAKNPWGLGGGWAAGREMNLAEAKTLLLACYASGGDLLLGDALPKLNDVGTGLLARLLRQPPVRRGIPLNLFAPDGDELPIVAAETVDPNLRLLILFNLGDDYRTQRIPDDYLAPGLAWTTFWSDETVPVPGAGEVALEPRSAVAWWIEGMGTAASQPSATT